MSDDDGRIIVNVLQQQQNARRIFSLDAGDMRRIAQRTVVRTEQGEVEVEVPDREEERIGVTQSDVRASLKVQAKLAQLGAVFQCLGSTERQDEDQ